MNGRISVLCGLSWQMYLSWIREEFYFVFFDLDLMFPGIPNGHRNAVKFNW